MIIVALLALPRLALAEPTAEDHERARALLAEGRTKRANDDHKGALEAFQRAHEIENLSTTGIEVGRTLVQLGRLVEARDLFISIARMPAQPGEPPPVTSARGEALTMADSLEHRIPTLAIKITGPIDPSVSATVDGVAIAIELLEQPRRVDPGAHTVVVHAGGLDRMVDVTVAEGENKEISIEVPRPDSGAAVQPLPAPPPQPRPPPKRSHTIAWVGAGMVVTGVTAGTLTGLSAISKTNTLLDVCSGALCPPPYHDELQRAETMATLSTISFIFAAAGFVLTVWDLARDQSPPSDPRNP